MSGAIAFSDAELRNKYREFARWYDLASAIPNALLGIRRMRRRLLRRVRGRVLEVAAGTGANLRYYAPDARPVLSDLSDAMLQRARRRIAGRRAFVAPLVQASADALPFRDGAFDTVVSTLSVCTFPNPVQALREIARVCRSDGFVLLLEHGASSVGWIARYQDRRAAKHAEALGCWWNRHPDALAREAGLRVVEVQRARAGIFYSLVAAPGA